MEYINKTDLIDLVHQNCPEYENDDIKNIINTFLDNVEALLINHNNISITNFGKFETKSGQIKQYFDVNEKRFKQSQPHFRLQYIPSPNLKKNVR